MTLKITGRLGPQIGPIYQRCGYHDLPIEFHPRMTHPELVKWLHESDVYVLPSLEEGMVRSATEAKTCGLLDVTTANSGTNDLITEGVNGSIVPLRDPQATANAVLDWWEKIRTAQHDPRASDMNREALSFERFTEKLLEHLRTIGL